MVELDTPDGGGVLTFAADTLQMNESMYIHFFGEIEFSGRLSVDVLDLFSMKKIGAYARSAGCVGLSGLYPLRSINPKA